MVIVKIICNKVCASALQTKRLINNNLKLPQDNDSPSKERNTSLQGLSRKTFALLPTLIIKQSSTCVKPRLCLQFSHSPISPFLCAPDLCVLPERNRGKGREKVREERKRMGCTPDNFAKIPLSPPSTVIWYYPPHTSTYMR